MTNFNNSNLNMLLRQLALTAQRHPPESLERQEALAQLVQAILQSGRLYQPPLENFLLRLYPESYNEAILNLLLYICLNIDNYDPEGGEVLAWCNFLLGQHFFLDAISRVFDRESIQRQSLDDLDTMALPEVSPNRVESIRNYIELEPVFRETYIPNYPEANFAAIAIQLLENKSWQEISVNLGGISIAIISSFFERHLNIYAPIVREYFDSI